MRGGIGDECAAETFGKGCGWYGGICRDHREQRKGSPSVTGGTALGLDLPPRPEKTAGPFPARFRRLDACPGLRDGRRTQYLRMTARTTPPILRERWGRMKWYLGLAGSRRMPAWSRM